jgi:hypothetical protein
MGEAGRGNRRPGVFRGETVPFATDSRLLLLHDGDNVLIARARIPRAVPILVEGAEILLPADLSIGHKLARRDIAPGEKILKYGAPIGSATQAIARGAHVHVHNVKSDYTPTHHLIDEQAAAGGQS